VDEGSTVTDFLPAERARGITIQSAAVTFHWPPSSESKENTSSVVLPLSQTSHTVNLIDTPGHADFTLDGVAGVEAQTEKVWMQANRYHIPRIIFINKLDRDGAAFGKAVREIGPRLRGLPAVCQIPLWQGGKGDFVGVVDIINLCGLQWEQGGDGKKIKRLGLDELVSVDPGLATEVPKARAALIDALCEFDEQLLNTWLELNDDSMAIPAQDIRDSLRRCILDGSGLLIPVFAGASFRNIGVQPLLDAVNDLLPNPMERPDAEISLGSVKLP
jgi:elongation factor G